MFFRFYYRLTRLSRSVLSFVEQIEKLRIRAKFACHALSFQFQSFAFALENSRKFHLEFRFLFICSASVLLKFYKKLRFYTSSDHESNQNEH